MPRSVVRLPLGRPNGPEAPAVSTVMPVEKPEVWRSGARAEGAPGASPVAGGCSAKFTNSSSLRGSELVNSPRAFHCLFTGPAGGRRIGGGGGSRRGAERGRSPEPSRLAGSGKPPQQAYSGLARGMKAPDVGGRIIIWGNKPRPGASSRVLRAVLRGSVLSRGQIYLYKESAYFGVIPRRAKKAAAPSW
jgi:hypothetical protein